VPEFLVLGGDAAGYVDALTGEGIAVALACARALVDCVAADDPGADNAAPALAVVGGRAGSVAVPRPPRLVAPL